MNVVVYDDDDARIELVKENLSEQENRLMIARDGDTLFGFVEDQMPDMIVSNFQLPKGGYDLVNAILARVQQPFPYLLFLTDDKNEKYVVDCLGPIPGDYVTLPLQEDELQARIVVADNAVTLHRYLRSNEDVSDELAMYDPETNMLNKQAVFERGLVEVSRSQRENHTVCLVVLDLVNAKEIAAEHGEEISRLAIRFVANTLRANIRMYDVVGRWADSRFMLLLPGLTGEYAGNVIQRIYDAVQEIKLRLMDDSYLELNFAAGYTWTEQGGDLPFSSFIDQANAAILQASTRQEGDRVLAYSGVNG